VQDHGHNFHHYVQIQYRGAAHRWTVAVNAGFRNDQPHVSFGGVWKKFMDFYNLVEGHRLKFTLIRRSLFDVEVVGSSGISTWHMLLLDSATSQS